MSLPWYELAQAFVGSGGGSATHAGSGTGELDFADVGAGTVGQETGAGVGEEDFVAAGSGSAAHAGSGTGDGLLGGGQPAQTGGGSSRRAEPRWIENWQWPSAWTVVEPVPAPQPEKPRKPRRRKVAAPQIFEARGAGEATHGGMGQAALAAVAEGTTVAAHSGGGVGETEPEDMSVIDELLAGLLLEVG